MPRHFHSFTTLFTALFALLSAPRLSHAHFDYSVFAGARLKPLGAATSIEGGYNFLLWGEAQNKNVLYGYLRPVLRAQTSVTVNLAEARLEFFPISFLGFSIGHKISHRSKDFSGIDCIAAVCQGILRDNYVAAKALAGYKKYFLALNSRLSTLSVEDNSRPFYEQSSAILGERGSDRLLYVDAALGRSFLDNHALGIFYSTDRMSNSKNKNELKSVFYQYKTGPHNWILGSGIYDSSIEEAGFTAYLTYSFRGLDSLGLD